MSGYFLNTAYACTHMAPSAGHREKYIITKETYACRRQFPSDLWHLSTQHFLFKYIHSLSECTWKSRPARWQILAHSESYFGQQQIISMPKYMQLLPCAGMKWPVSVGHACQHVCQCNETHHIVTGCKDITVEESALPLGIWLSAQVPFTWPYKYVVTFTLDQTRTGRQKVIECLNTLKYPHGLKGRDPHIKKRVTESQMGLKLWEGDLKRKGSKGRNNEEFTSTCPRAQLSPKVCALLTSMWLEVVMSFTVTLSKFPQSPLRRPWWTKRR